MKGEPNIDADMIVPLFGTWYHKKEKKYISGHSRFSFAQRHISGCGMHAHARICVQHPFSLKPKDVLDNYTRIRSILLGVALQIYASIYARAFGLH